MVEEIIKRGHLFPRLQKKKVLFFQETHTIRNDKTDWGLWLKGSYRLSHGTNFSAGVAILFKETINTGILSPVDVVKGCLLIVKAKIEDSVFVFVNIYAPNNGIERANFYITVNQI